MLIPQSFALAAFIGGTFDGQLNFWQDSAKTVPFDFSPWTISWTASGSGTLIPSYTVVGGSLLLSLTATQTATASPGTESLLITLTDGATPASIEFLARGSITYTAP